MTDPASTRKPACLHLKLIGGEVRPTGDLQFTAGHVLGNEPVPVRDGVYASWRWDGVALEISNCRYGLHPLFYYFRSGEFCISTSLVELLDRVGPQDFDDDAIAVFLRIGYFLEDDTPFRNIRVVPPLANWRWSASGLTRTQREYEPDAGCSASRNARLDDYVSIFRQAMQRRPPAGDVIHPLSGGRDSRHILFELVQSGMARTSASLDCVTSQSKSLEDARVAGALCEVLGLPHTVIAQEPSFVAAALRKNQLTSFCSDEHTWAMSMCDLVNRKKVTLYDGIGGDVLSAGLFSSPERLKWLRAGASELFVVDLFGSAEGELQRWLRPDVRRRFSRERAVARASAVASRYGSQPNPVASFFFDNRTRREIALYSCCLFRADTLLYMPFLDHRVVDYLMSIPCEDLIDKKFHTDALARGYPQWANLPYALDESDPRAARLSSLTARRFSTRLALVVAELLMQRRDAWVDRLAVLPRLVGLLGRTDARRSAFWFNPERIVWATQLERLALGWHTEAD
jgi:asparagine synthetase B (glutamine-hydrolysing)